MGRDEVYSRGTRRVEERKSEPGISGLIDREMDKRGDGEIDAE